MLGSRVEETYLTCISTVCLFSSLLRVGAQTLSVRSQRGGVYPILANLPVASLNKQLAEFNIDGYVTKTETFNMF